MSFGAILQSIVDGCGGGIGAALMAEDGVPIEEVMARQSHDGLPFDEVGTVGVEFVRILEEIRKAAAALDGGQLGEAVVALEKYTLIFRVVDRETFLVLILRKDGNLGKARYLIRRHLLEIQAALSE